MIHYKDLVCALSGAGVKFRDVKQPGEKNGPVSSGHWSNIVKGKAPRKKRDHYNSKRLTQETIDTIQAFWCSNEVSRYSPSHTCVMQQKTKTKERRVDNVYFRQCTIKKAFQLFCQRYPKIKLARSAFHRWMPKNVKPARSKFDVCPICKEADRYQCGLEERQAIPGAQMTVEEITTLEGMQFHRKVAAQRKVDGDKQIEFVKEKHAILTMDFKANITLGGGAEVDSRVWFKAPQRTIFGVAVFLQKDSKMYKVMFTVISKVLMHDTKTVIEMLRTCVLNHSVFKWAGTTNLSFWMDNAPNHFRTKEMIAGFYDIQKEMGFNVEFNFFAEYHGKSECDRHFGLISRIYADHCARAVNPDVETTEDFIKAYKSSLLEHGSHVIPSVGADLSELLPESGVKLNVVCKEFLYDDLSIPDDAALSSGADDSGDEQRGAASFKIPRPYNARVFKERQQFVLGNFYRFRFQGDVLLCQLFQSSPVHKIRFGIVEKEKSAYSVKIAKASSGQKRFAVCQKSYAKYLFHNQ